MTFEELTRHFDIKKRNGNSVQAICPVHGDQKASLTITDKGNKAVLYCHAGCKTEDILQAAGLSMKNLFYNDALEEQQDGKPSWQRYVEGREKCALQTGYNYNNVANGEYAFTRLRMENKKFIYGIFDNDGRFHYGLQKKPRREYRAVYGDQKRFKDHIADGKAVFYAEGEKDVNTLQKKGYAALTAGAAKDWDGSYAEMFNGVNLVILADNDEPGKELARNVYSDVKEITKSCKIIIPVKDTLKADITDYFEAGHTVEEFEEMIQQQDDTKAVLDSIPRDKSTKRGKMLYEECTSVPFDPFDPIDGNLNKILQPFPIEHLPSEIQTYIEAVAESLQVPVDMVASLVLAALSLCIQGKFYVKVKSDWVEPVNLYMVVIGRPSERKSPVLKEIEEPIFSYMVEENEKRKPEIKKYELEKKILSGKLKTIQDALAKNGKNNKYTMQDAFDCQEELDDLEEVKPLRLVMDDTTPEALVDAMKQNEEKMGILSAEGGIFGVMAGRYSNDVNIDIFLKAYSGEYLALSRIGREGTELKHPYLTIGLAVQPQVIGEVMENKNFRGRGLLARFMYSIPNSRVGSRKYRTDPIKDVTRKVYEDLCKDLLAIPDLTDFAERIITLSNEADLLSEEYNQWIEGKLLDDLETIEDWAGKLHGNTMRIAGILHVVKHRLNSVNVPLEEDTMKAAIEIGKYYLEHSKQAFEIMDLTDPQNIKDAKYILSRIGDRSTKRDKITEITKRDLQKMCKQFKKKEDMEPGLQCLLEHGYIRIEEKRTKGRPSTKIFINPEYYQWKEQQRQNDRAGIEKQV